MSHRLPVADIQFISDFAAFCRTKGGEGYSYTSYHDCACAQFLKASGKASEPRVTPFDWRDGLHSAIRHPLPAGVNDALNPGNDTQERFDLLADRLEALIADAPAIARVTGAS